MPTRMNPDGSIASDWDMNVTGSKYQDLGQIITGGAIAAGSVVYETNWHDGVEWVRSLVALMQSDQTVQLAIQLRDTSNTNSWGIAIGSAGTASNPQWNAMQYLSSQAILGKSVKFGLKNTAAAATTVANLRIQLMGL